MWKERLEHAMFTNMTSEDPEHIELEMDADDWEQCYIGELRHALIGLGFEFNEMSLAPLDGRLKALGGEFARRIAQRDYHFALCVMKEIDAYVLSYKEKEGGPYHD